MKEDLSTGVKIVVGLVLLVAISGVILALFKVFKSNTDAQSLAAQRQADSIQKIAWEDFDDEDLKGSKVLHTMQLYKGDPYIFVLKTKGVKTNWAGTYAAVYNTLTPNSTIETFRGKSYRFIDVFDDEDTTSHSNSIYKKKDSKGRIGCYIREYYNDEVQYDSNYTYLTDSTSETYISGTANFHAELIYEDNGETVGIYFEEVD